MLLFLLFAIATPFDFTEKNVEEYVDALYVEMEPPNLSWEDLYASCSSGLKIGKTQSNPKLIKIGGGGDRCIVSHGSLAIAQTLEELGFNGYLFVRITDIPNPHSKVCGSSKLLTMIEAKNEGFTNLLWVEPSLLPLVDPTPLFDRVEAVGALIEEEPRGANNRFLPPGTKRILKEKTNVDMYETPLIRTSVFGLKMDGPQVKEIIEKYIELQELGTPFFSCYPEEFVLSALCHGSFRKSVYQNVMLEKSSLPFLIAYTPSANPYAFFSQK